MEYIVRTEKIRRLDRYDVIVAGGGVAGAAAALEAVRHAKRVLLIEKSVTLGGLATLGLINFFVPMCNGRGVRIVKGLAEELLRDSIRYGYDTMPGDWKSGVQTEKSARYMTAFSAGIFALVLADKLAGEKVDVLLDSVVSEPVMEGGVCTGVIVENKSGRSYYECGSLVDSTGDCDILYRAGVPTVSGRNYFTYIAKGVSLSSAQRAVRSGNIADIYENLTGGGASLYGDGQIDGVRLYEGTTARDVTEYVMENQKILLEKLRGGDRCARDVAALPGMAQLRTTRRIEGDETLAGEDVYRHFDTSVCAVNDFDRACALYEIPYGALVRSGYDNLITCGRSVSASGWAWDVTRVIPPAILTGQAAGLACALRAENGRPLPEQDVSFMQSVLEREGVTIHFDDALVPQDRGCERIPVIAHM